MTRNELGSLVADLATAIAQAVNVPAWAIKGGAALVRAAISLFLAKSDAEREAAAMSAAEEAKALADLAKFGPRT